MLKMSVCTSDIPGMLSEPASLRGSIFCRVVLTSAAVTLRGVITDDGMLNVGEGAGNLKRGP